MIYIVSLLLPINATKWCYFWYWWYCHFNQSCMDTNCQQICKFHRIMLLFDFKMRMIGLQINFLMMLIMINSLYLRHFGIDTHFNSMRKFLGISSTTIWLLRNSYKWFYYKNYRPHFCIVIFLAYIASANSVLFFFLFYIFWFKFSWFIAILVICQFFSYIATHFHF